MGWDCGAGSMSDDTADMDDAESEMSDDTDALAPAEEDIELPDPK